MKHRVGGWMHQIEHLIWLFLEDSLSPRIEPSCLWYRRHTEVTAYSLPTEYSWDVSVPLEGQLNDLVSGETALNSHACAQHYIIICTFRLYHIINWNTTQTAILHWWNSLIATCCVKKDWCNRRHMNIDEIEWNDLSQSKANWTVNKWRHETTI